MQVAPASMEQQTTSMYFYLFHGGSSGLGLGLGLVFWKQVEVCDTRESRWKYVGVYESSWKLPLNILVEDAIDGSNGSFRIHRQHNIPCTCMEASKVMFCRVCGLRIRVWESY